MQIFHKKLCVDLNETLEKLRVFCLENTVEKTTHFFIFVIHGNKVEVLHYAFLELNSAKS